MTSTQLFIAAALFGLPLLAAFAAYRWRQRRRVGRVEKWVKDFVSARCQGPPAHLTINCSEDPLWPVLAAFDDPRTGVHHRLQFTCAGAPSTFALVSDKEDVR